MKTKTIFTALFFLIAFVGFSQTSQRREASRFDKIDASGAANVNYTPSDSFSVKVIGSADELALIETKVQDDILFVKTKGNIRNPFKIEVSCPVVNLLTLSGASKFESKGELKSDSLTIEASGASTADIFLSARVVRATVSGASNINLSGNTQSFHSTTSGASTLKAYKLNSLNTWVIASGASTAKVFAAQKIAANATGASTIKFKGDPKEVTAEGSTSSQIMRINPDETTSTKHNGKDSSSTSFNIGNKKFFIVDNDRDTTHLHFVPSFKYWRGFHMGTTGYVTASQDFSVPKPYNYLELDYSKCFNFQLNIVQRNFSIYKNYVNVITGIGFEWNQYEFANKVKLNADSSFTWGDVDSSNAFRYTKNRLKTAYVTVPLMLDFNTNKNPRKSLHIAIGVVGELLIGARQKQVMFKDNVKYKNLRDDNYNLNPVRINAFASIGYNRIIFYAEYGLNPLFRQGHGPELYAFSAGIRLVGFDDLED